MSFEHPKYDGSVGLRSGQVSLIYFAQAVRIIYAEDRAQMNREFLKLSIQFEMENWISGAAGRKRQHDAVMAFITGRL